MFRGINSINLDVKGRMAVPMRYRAELCKKSDLKSVIITIDPEDHCLLLYPFIVWEEIEQRVSQLSSFDPRTRRIQRLLIGHATEEQLDGNGRILLPQLLREYANLSKEIILVGQGKKLEIWDSKFWNVGRENWLNEKVTLENLPEELKGISL